ncbi:hypothetical protein pb186bvf_005348 [Paramecium bursaria]
MLDESALQYQQVLLLCLYLEISKGFRTLLKFTYQLKKYIFYSKRIGNQSKRSKSQPSSNRRRNDNIYFYIDLEEHCKICKVLLKWIYGEKVQIHLGFYDVNARSRFHSKCLSNNRVQEQKLDSDKQQNASLQSQDKLLEEKNRLIRLLAKELAYLKGIKKRLDNLQRENQELQQKRLSNQEYSQIISAGVQEQAENIKQLENQIEMQFQLNSAICKGGQLKMLQTSIMLLNRILITNQNNENRQEDSQSRMIKLNQNIKKKLFDFFLFFYFNLLR